MTKPTIEELHSSEEFEIIAELSHNEIKDFVLNQLTQPSRMITGYMIYQLLMILTGLFFFSRSVIFAIRGIWEPLYFSTAGLIFTFSFLIAIHELLHGVTLKITGAQKLSFGAYWKKFIFYAEADRHVLNRDQFALVALTPLFIVKLITLIGIIWYLHQPAFFFFIFVMSAHSLFCAGDIGLLSIFYREKDAEIFTYDVKEKKKSYYFRKISGHKLP